MSLGLVIAKARKDAGLSLDDLADKTKIRKSVLAEIENDIFINCGGETYARGHVRNIAKALGADAKEFIRIFEDEQGSETRSIQDLLVESNVIREQSEPRKVSWKVLLVISLVSLALVGIAQILISNTDTKDVANVTPTASAQPTASNSPSADAPTENTYSTGSGVEVIVNASRNNSWLFVADANGQTLFSGQILRGSTKVFTSDTALNLKLGNAGGVDLTVNGNPIDPVGLDGEVVSVSYGVDS
jgi:cytoskeleton protein RodZ